MSLTLALFVVVILAVASFPVILWLYGRWR